jgi:hypothetical protein
MKQNKKIVMSISLLILVFITNCSTPHLSKENHHTLIEESVKVAPKFDPKKSFQVASASPDITTSSSSIDTIRCTDWTLGKAKIQSIISRGEIVNGPDWHHLFDVLPCIIVGEIEQDKSIYQYEMNGGSWIYIRSPDTTFILGIFSTEEKKYFLSSPMTEVALPL